MSKSNITASSSLNKNYQNKQSKLLPLKLLFLSYFNNYQNQHTLSDCYNAISTRIQKLSSVIEQNYQEISAIVGNQTLLYQSSQQSLFSQNNEKRQQKNSIMEIIEQEDYCVGTERSYDEDGDRKLFGNNGSQTHSIKHKNLLMKSFNNSITKVQKSRQKFESLIFMYKKQIKQIALDLTKEKELRKTLQQQLLGHKQLSDLHHISATSTSANNHSRKSSKEAKSTSVNKSTNNKLTASGFTSLLPKPGTNSLSNYSATTKRSVNISKQQQSQDQEARQPPKPFCEECSLRQKQNTIKAKQQLEEKNKWKELSNKITNLKNQLTSYQEQLLNKQTQINKLNEQLKKKSEDQNKQETEEKKKLRSMNTTLRGEKIVLQNQVQSLRKKNDEYEEFVSSISAQNQKFKLQKQNLQSTVQWHTNTIKDLRTNFSSGLKQDAQLVKRLNQSEKTNKVLYEQILTQQKYLQQFVQKLKEIEQKNKQQIQKLTKKLKNLQAIIQQKNETIIKLKLAKDQNNSFLANTQFLPNRQRERQNLLLKREDLPSGMILTKGSKKQSLNSTANYSTNQNQHQSSQGFQQNMIKILSKKLVERQSLIQKLEKQNQILKLQVQGFREEYME